MFSSSKETSIPPYTQQNVYLNGKILPNKYSKYCAVQYASTNYSHLPENDWVLIFFTQLYLSRLPSNTVQSGECRPVLKLAQSAKRIQHLDSIHSQFWARVTSHCITILCTWRVYHQVIVKSSKPLYTYSTNVHRWPAALLHVVFDCISQQYYTFKVHKFPL